MHPRPDEAGTRASPTGYSILFKRNVKRGIQIFIAANPVRHQKHIDDRPLVRRQLDALMAALCLQNLLKLKNRFLRLVKLVS